MMPIAATVLLPPVRRRMKFQLAWRIAERTTASIPRSGAQVGRLLAVRRLAVVRAIHHTRGPFGVEQRWEVSNHVPQDVLDAVAEVVAVPQQALGARSLREQKHQERLVSLGGVAALAGEDEVVAPVVRGLTLSRCDVVEREA